MENSIYQILINISGYPGIDEDLKKVNLNRSYADLIYKKLEESQFPDINEMDNTLSDSDKKYILSVLNFWIENVDDYDTESIFELTKEQLIAQYQELMNIWRIKNYEQQYKSDLQ